MAKSIRVGAHSCVINLNDKNAGPQVGGKYGRIFPWISPCEAEEAAIVDLVVFATDAQA